MDSISPDIAKKLLTRDFANLAQRVQRGGNLSKSERVMLMMATRYIFCGVFASSYASCK